MHLIVGLVLVALFLVIFRAIRRRMPMLLRHFLALLGGIVTIAVLLFFIAIALHGADPAHMSTGDIIAACLFGAVCVVVAAGIGMRTAWRAMYMAEDFRDIENGMREREREARNRFYAGLEPRVSWRERS